MGGGGRFKGSGFKSCRAELSAFNVALTWRVNVDAEAWGPPLKAVAAGAWLAGGAQALAVGSTEEERERGELMVERSCVQHGACRSAERGALRKDLVPQALVHSCILLSLSSLSRLAPLAFLSCEPCSVGGHGPSEPLLSAAALDTRLLKLPLSVAKLRIKGWSRGELGMCGGCRVRCGRWREGEERQGWGTGGRSRWWGWSGEGG
eukprot:2029128-Rhodomonas_salina.1